MIDTAAIDFIRHWWGDDPDRRNSFALDANKEQAKRLQQLGLIGELDKLALTSVFRCTLTTLGKSYAAILGPDNVTPLL